MNQLPPWRQDLAATLNRARSQPESRYLQLATIAANGRPANRTLVFRGFDEVAGHTRLLMVSDQRSAKMSELAAQPSAEACWYFGRTREQFRLAGTVTLHRPQDPDPSLCAARWDLLSAAARAQYFWPQPGTPLEPAQAPEPVASSTPAPWFLVLALTPTVVDHLDLRSTPQRRTRHEHGPDGWQTLALNP